MTQPMHVDPPNWFQNVEPLFDYYLGESRGTPGLRILQIGAYTGDASVWFLDNMLTGPGSLLTDVDTWEGSDEEEHEPLDWAEVYTIYLSRTEGRNATHHRMSSDQFFHEHAGQRFDMIYVDGDHTRVQVARDARNADRALEPGGLLIFDDYTWIGHPDGHNPRDAVNAFLGSEGYRYQIIHKGHQMWLQKVADAQPPAI